MQKFSLHLMHQVIFSESDNTYDYPSKTQHVREDDEDVTSEQTRITIERPVLVAPVRCTLVTTYMHHMHFQIHDTREH
jgi:hypothetical protein